MSDDSQERGAQVRTHWYADPRAKAVLAILGVAVPLLGVAVALATLMIEIWSPSTSTTTELNSETDFSQVIQGDTVSIRESLEVSDPVDIVAESVVVSENATLSSPRIWIIANEVKGEGTGGTLDVSGAEGTAEDLDGSDAGSIYVLAARVDGMTFRAAGGNGAKGGKGRRGPDGRNGRCGAGVLNQYEANSPGGRGGVGEQGGMGGDGGNIRVAFGACCQPRNVDNSPGRGGEGGPGGSGGSGGRGCAGVGGVQSDAPAGPDGPPGPNGRDGSAGSWTAEKKPELVDNILSWTLAKREKGNLAPESLQHAKISEEANANP